MHLCLQVSVLCSLCLLYVCIFIWQLLRPRWISIGIGGYLEFGLTSLDLTAIHEATLVVSCVRDSLQMPVIDSHIPISLFQSSTTTRNESMEKSLHRMYLWKGSGVVLTEFNWRREVRREGPSSCQLLLRINWTAVIGLVLFDVNSLISLLICPTGILKTRK